MPGGRTLVDVSLRVAPRSAGGADTDPDTDSHHSNSVKPPGECTVSMRGADAAHRDFGGVLGTHPWRDSTRDGSLEDQRIEKQSAVDYSLASGDERLSPVRWGRMNRVRRETEQP